MCLDSGIAHHQRQDPRLGKLLSTPNFYLSPTGSGGWGGNQIQHPIALHKPWQQAMALPARSQYPSLTGELVFESWPAVALPRPLLCGYSSYSAMGAMFSHCLLPFPGCVFEEA